MKPLYDYQDYRRYIFDKINQNSEFRGYQGQLAKAAGCQRSFLSQALNSHIQLTLDHAAGLCEFWRFNEDETHYFIDLVNLARSSSEPLKKVLKKKLQQLREKNRDLSQRFKSPQIEEGSGYESRYYSSWIWAALHIGMAVPELQSVDKIAERFGLSPMLVQNYLAELEKMGLVEKRGTNTFRITNKSIHVAKTSPSNFLNHMNWRNRAVQNAQIDGEDAVHYTAVYAMSKDDARKIRNLFLECIDRSREVVIPSPEEDVYCVACDFFRA